MSSNKLTLAQVEWSNEAVPISQQFDDVYFSTDDGLAEVQHTFIEPNNLSQRFSNLSTKQGFRIAETGFGSGLNFLLICQQWLMNAPAESELHFISFEKHPLHPHDLKKAHDALPEATSLEYLTSELQQHYPLLLPGWHDAWLFSGRVRLTLWFGDVLKGLPECDASPSSLMDAWLLDGFAPSKNPDMWQPSLYQQMARLSHENTTFATFTSAGDVRRALTHAGFSVNKQPGFGKKREMSFGQLQHKRPFSLKAPWFSRPQPILSREKTAIVIGAGLAGAAVANKLAIAGWQVTVLEAAEDVATQASGNLAGAIHPLITADWNLRSQWYLQGFEATLRTVKPWLKNSNSQELMGDLTGLVNLMVTEVGQKRVNEAFERVGLPDDFARLLTAEQASALLTTKVTHSALLFLEGGWLYPKAVINHCLHHELVRLHTKQKVVDIEKTQQDKWHVKTESQGVNADIVIVATGSLDSHLNKKLALPIRPVKGQVSHISAEQQKQVLPKVVTHEGYSCSYGAGAVTGATFEAPDMSDSLSLKSHQTNLAMSQTALPDWLSVSAEELDGRIAFRPTTPDHLPIVGAVANPSWMEKSYLSQSHTHAVYRYPVQQYQTGLYVSNGHGARGLMSVFLAAENLLADIEGRALTQPLSLYNASHPARFQIRHWRSGKQETEA